MAQPQPRDFVGAIRAKIAAGLPAVIADAAAHSLGQPPFVVLGAFSWALLVTGFCAPRVGKWSDAHGGRGALSLSVLVLAAGALLDPLLLLVVGTKLTSIALVLAALGPRMLELSRDRALGAHPYFSPPEHTEFARSVLGAAPLLVLGAAVAAMAAAQLDWRTLLGGIAAGVDGHLFGQQAWISVSLGVFVAEMAFMLAVTAPYYRRLRRVMAIEQGGGTAVGAAEIEQMVGSSVPLVAFWGGSLGLLFIGYLRAIKPF